MKTSNQLSVTFRRVRQISQSALASSRLTTRGTSSSELTAPAASKLATTTSSELPVPASNENSPVVAADANRAKAARRRDYAVKRTIKTLALLLTPVLLSTLYVFAWGTPMYVSETHFAIRGGEAMRSSGVLGGMIAGSANSPLAGMVDGYSVRDFLQSREAMDKLDESVGFVSRVANPSADVFTRLSPTATREKTYRAYQSFIQVTFNMVEQIVVVRAYAYSAEDAKVLAKALSKLAETFADDLNKRSRDDALKLSEGEMERADKRVRDARVLLNEWRSRNANIDPTANVTMINQLIGSLESSLADTRSQLMVLNLAAQDNPNRRNLEQRVGIIRDQIAEAKKRLTGTESRSEALQLNEYERLKLELDSAEKARDATRGVLDDNRVQTMRQQKYVFTVAAPSKPDWAEWPYPYRFFFGGIIGGILLYLLVSLFSSMFRPSHA